MTTLPATGNEDCRKCPVDGDLPNFTALTCGDWSSLGKFLLSEFAYWADLISCCKGGEANDREFRLLPFAESDGGEEFTLSLDSTGCGLTPPAYHTVEDPVRSSPIVEYLCESSPPYQTAAGSPVSTNRLPLLLEPFEIVRMKSALTLQVIPTEAT